MKLKNRIFLSCQSFNHFLLHLNKLYIESVIMKEEEKLFIIEGGIRHE